MNLITEIIRHGGESLSFKEKEPVNPVTVSPAVNLKDLYDLFQQHGDGSVLEDCLRLIQALYEKQELKAIKAIMDSWDEIKERVVLTVVNKEWNETLLNSGRLMYKEMLDFAIIPRILIQDVSLHVTGSAVITKGMLNFWRIDENTFWEEAEYNLYQEAFEIKTLNEIIAEEMKKIRGKNARSGQLFDRDKESMWEREVMHNQYVMSNKERYYGAIAMLRIDLLEEFAEKKGCNFFILPSSIHEIMLVPDNGFYTVNGLQDTVRSVNENELEAIEKLSDDVYYFRKGNHSVQRAE